MNKEDVIKILKDKKTEYKSGIVYGEQEARDNYCNYYVSDFKSVEAFISDFNI